MRQVKVPSIEPYRDLSVEFLNTLLSSHQYWNRTLKSSIQIKFLQCLSEVELDNNYDLMDCIFTVVTHNDTSIVISSIQIIPNTID